MAAFLTVSCKLTLNDPDHVGVLHLLHVADFSVQPFEHSSASDVLLSDHLQSDLQTKESKHERVDSKELIRGTKN